MNIITQKPFGFERKIVYLSDNIKEFEQAFYDKLKSLQPTKVDMHKDRIVQFVATAQDGDRLGYYTLTLGSSVTEYGFCITRDDVILRIYHIGKESN